MRRKHSFSEQTETEADSFSVPGGQAQGKTLQHFNFREISKILEGQWVRRGDGERAEVRRGLEEDEEAMKRQEGTKGRVERQSWNAGDERGTYSCEKSAAVHHFPVTSLFETQVRHRSDNCIHAFTVRSDCGLFWRFAFFAISLHLGLSLEKRSHWVEACCRKKAGQISRLGPLTGSTSLSYPAEGLSLDRGRLFLLQLLTGCNSDLGPKNLKVLQQSQQQWNFFFFYFRQYFSLD